MQRILHECGRKRALHRWSISSKAVVADGEVPQHGGKSTRTVLATLILPDSVFERSIPRLGGISNGKNDLKIRIVPQKLLSEEFFRPVAHAGKVVQLGDELVLGYGVFGVELVVE